MFFIRTLWGGLSDTQASMKLSPDQQPRSKNISGFRIRQARMEFSPRLTQDQLSGRLAADGIQLDRVAITKIETGARCVMDFELRGISRALKKDVNWLLGMPASTNTAPLKKKGRSSP
jgi:hypothetical protein